MTGRLWLLSRSAYNVYLTVVWLLAVNSCRGWQSPARKIDTKVPGVGLTPTDKKVYEAVWAAITARSGSDSFRPLYDHGYLVDHAWYYGFDPDKVKAGVGARLAAELQADIERRGQTRVSLQGFHLPKTRLMSDAELRQLFAKEDHDAQETGTLPNHRLILWISLPGYSHNKRSALVDFRFNDGTRHGGGVGGCVVDQRQGRWKVRWKQICE